MVCIVEAEVAFCVFELLSGQALQRRLRSHGHEHREVDGPVGQCHDRGARPRCLGRVLSAGTRHVERETHRAFGDQLKVERGRRRRQG